MSVPGGAPVDVRGLPANACPLCGGRVLRLRALFDDYDIAMWFLDAECDACGALLTAPCPPDRPEGYWASEDGEE